MPIAVAGPEPTPPPVQLPPVADPPWTWTVAELGRHLTEAQRKTLLARFRTLGLPVKTWPVP